MTVVMRLNNFTLADPSGFTKLEEDTSLYVDLLSHFDFLDPTVIGENDSLAAGSSLPNIVADANAMLVVNAYVEGIQAAKGLIHGATFESADLGSEFDLLNLEASSSFIIQAWVTDIDENPNNSSVIAGHAYQSNAYAQWLLWKLNTGEYRMQLGNVVANTSLPPGVPTLLSMIGKYENEEYTVIFYKGSEKLIEGVLSGPFRDPDSGSAGAVPKLGILGGIGNDWRGVLHGIKIGVVTDTFDPAGYIANEISENASRYTV